MSAIGPNGICAGWQAAGAAKLRTGTDREQTDSARASYEKISENPRFKEAPSSGTGYVIGGHKTTK
jgi:hypothetical protein